MGDKKKKDEEPKRDSSSSHPAPQQKSTQEAVIQTGGDSSVPPATSAPPPSSIPTTTPPANPATVRGQSSKRKRSSEIEQSEAEAFCPICFRPFKSMQAMRGHLNAHDKEEREPYFASPKSKAMKQKEMIAAMNLTSMKAADNFWPINKQNIADAREKQMLSSPLRIVNPHLDIDCNKTPPPSPSSSPPPPSPPDEHPGLPFNLNRSPPPSPGAAGQAQPVV